MIIDRYLFKEIIISFISVVTVLLLIFSSKHFVRYMSDAAAGELPTSMIFQLLSLFTLSYMVLIVPFAIYLAVIITLGRLYKDNEITAAEACGLGLPRIMKSIFYLSLILSFFVGVLSMWVAPWAESAQHAIRDQARSESEFSFITAGRFHEIRGGRGVFYVENVEAKSGKMSKVFVYLKDENKTDVFSSLTGYMDKDKETGSHYIVLQDGFRFEVLAEDDGYRLHQYKKSGIRITQATTGSINVRIAEKNMANLMSDESRAAQAELHWRIAMPISCVLLTMMAVLLSKTNSRQGRFGKLFIALLAYIAYVYTLMLTRSMLKQGDIPLFVGMWWVHALAILFIVLLLIKQFGWRWLLSLFFSAKKLNKKPIEGMT